MLIRILTGTVGAIIFLSFLLIGGPLFGLFIYLLALIAYAELIKMSGLRLFYFPSIIGGVVLSLVFLPSVFSVFESGKYAHLLTIENLLIGFILIYLLSMVLTENRLTLEHFGVFVVGIFYIGFGFSYFVQTRFDLELGLPFIFFILLCVWFMDSGAYFTGKKWGKNKLSPISPNKTIEGLVGGIVCAVLIAIIFQVFTNYFDSIVQVMGIAIIIALAGQVGDLVESALKRYYKVKDSGQLLPGHGGVLDRFDSLLFVFVLLYMLQVV